MERKRTTSEIEYTTIALEKVRLMCRIVEEANALEETLIDLAIENKNIFNLCEMIVELKRLKVLEEQFI